MLDPPRKDDGDDVGHLTLPLGNKTTDCRMEPTLFHQCRKVLLYNRRVRLDYFGVREVEDECRVWVDDVVGDWSGSWRGSCDSTPLPGFQ